MLVSCAGAQAPRASLDASADERAIGAMLDDWHDAAARADETRYFGHFAPGGVFLGTDATERWDIPAFRAYAHPRFASGRAWSFHAVERHVHVADANLAWFDERLATERLGPARGSGVVVRAKGGAWRIEQYNLALTIPNERFEDVRRALDAPAAPPAKRCLPVVAPLCGCVYSCGSGVEVAPGRWSVMQQTWGKTPVNAKIASWCVGGQCTDAFHGEIVCDGVCAPRPADPTCHFEGDVCVSARDAAP